MKPSTTALQRSRRRASSGGAVMFIISMTVAVLAAVGLYALSAASTEIRTTGYERQNAQTHYLSEYGILGSAQEVSGTKAQLYVGLMVSLPDTSCRSLPGVPSSGVTSWGTTVGPLSKACRRMGSAELSGWIGQSTATPTSWATQVLDPYNASSSTPAASLGPAPMTGDFYVELTDPRQIAPPAGFDLKLGLCFVQVTVSSTGITQQFNVGEMAQFGNEGVENARSRIIGGPIRCPQ